MPDTNIFDHIIETPGLAGRLRSLTASGDSTSLLLTFKRTNSLGFMTLRNGGPSKELGKS